MKKLPTLIVFGCLLAAVGAASAQQQERQRQRERQQSALPKPDHENIKYGPHERNVVCSYDPRFVEAFGIPRPNLELHSFFLPFYDIEEGEIDSKKANRLYDEMAAITFLTKDDPPALLSYNFPDRDADPNTELNLVVHHPRFGIVLKEKMDALGIECVVQYKEGDDAKGLVRHGGGDPVEKTDFIGEQFEKAKRR